MKKAKKEDQMPVDRKCLDVVLRFVTRSIQEKEKPQKEKKKKVQFSCFGKYYKTKVLSCYGKTLYFKGRWPKSETAFFAKKRNNASYFLELEVFAF